MTDHDTARSQINVLLRQAEALLDQAGAIADASQVSFDWDYLGFGMGGSYQPKRLTYEAALEIIAKGDPLTEGMREKIVQVLRDGRDDEWESSDAEGWVSSSSYC